MQSEKGLPAHEENIAYLLLYSQHLQEALHLEMSEMLREEWNTKVNKELYHLNLISQKSTMHESPYSLQ